MVLRRRNISNAVRVTSNILRTINQRFQRTCVRVFISRSCDVQVSSKSASECVSVYETGIMATCTRIAVVRGRAIKCTRYGSNFIRALLR